MLEEQDETMKLLMFSKNIDSLPLAEAAAAMQQMGFDGVDLPVRPGSGTLPPGRVLPQNAREDLPKVIKILSDFGLQVPMLSTAVVNADDPDSAGIFEAAGANGVSDIKVQLWPYPGFGSFASEMEVIARRLDGLEKLAERSGVRAVVHVHSGNVMSASPFMVWYWIKDRNPAAVGAYVDFEHVTLETGAASRRMALDLLGKRINVIGVKDFAWAIENGSDLVTKLSSKRVPIGNGVVPWPEIFSSLKQADADPLVSVHSEYLGAKSWKPMTVPELIQQTKADVKYLRAVINSSGLG